MGAGLKGMAHERSRRRRAAALGCAALGLYGGDDHGSRGRMPLRQHPCAPAALEASGGHSGANLYLLILPQPQSPHDLGPGRIARTLSRRLVARRILSLRHADCRFRDLSPLRGLHCGNLGFIDEAVCGGKRELPRRPRAFQSTRGDARIPGRDARSSNLSTHGQLDACRSATLARCVDVRIKSEPISGLTAPLHADRPALAYTGNIQARCTSAYTTHLVTH